MPLTAEQQRCVDIAGTGVNMGIFGHAGAGKSVLMRRILHLLAKGKGVSSARVATTATTGIAALLVEGTTYHRWAGVGIMEGDPRAWALAASKFTLERVRGTRTLLMDESSMLSARQFNYLDDYLRAINQRERPFGGIQVILAGDIGQMGPVAKRGDAPSNGQFFFESPRFQQYFKKEHVVVLRQNFRQRSSPGFAAILGRAADGCLQPGDMAVLRGCCVDEGASLEGRGPLLMATNAKAEAHNQRNLRRLPGAEVTYVAKCKLATKDEACTKFDPKAQIEQIKKAHLAPPSIVLKVGAQVMLLVNVDQKLGLVNGTTVTVAACNSKKVTINYHHKGQELQATVLPHTWKHKVHRVGEFEYTQWPIKLAWAITVHKSQGMTLDRVCVFPDGFFAHGQAYTALTRVRDPEGLTIVGGIPEHVMEADPRALAFYAKYRHVTPAPATTHRSLPKARPAAQELRAERAAASVGASKAARASAGAARRNFSQA